MEYQLYSAGETTLYSSILGYDIMSWTDKFMPLSQFSALLTGCGYDPITLEGQYRYYFLEQLPIAGRINALKDMGFHV